MSQPLRYGLNPHQSPATYEAIGDALPFEVLNGQPGYINMLDALSSWQLVRELSAATGLAAAASFKHVSPAGAAVATPLNDALRAAYLLPDDELSPAATAYARARGGDLTSAYGDFAAVSEPVDASLARVLRREVSDGVVAPGYEPDALEIISRKKGGRYLVLQADPAFEPPANEARELFGVRLQQPADTRPIGDALFEHVVTEASEFPAESRRDLLIATIALRYTQSNSVCVAADGQVIGLGAGQQSRIHCTRLACGKADRWMLQQHPQVLSLAAAGGPAARRPDQRPGAVHPLGRAFRRGARPAGHGDRPAAGAADRRATRGMDRRASAMCSATTPSSPSGTTSTAPRPAPSATCCSRGGASPTTEVIAAADAYGIAMAHTGQRLFRH